MEGLKHLKELEYLNLAVNSVKKIEGLRRCESLNKLDLTLNFVDLDTLEESMDELEYCPHMREMYLTGNPCDKWENCKDYVIARIPSLLRLDGTDVNKGVRLAAKNKLPQMEEELKFLAAKCRAEKEWEKKEGKHNPDAWSPENRWRDYVEAKEKKEEEEKNREENSMFKDYNKMERDAEKMVSYPFVVLIEFHYRKSLQRCTLRRARPDK